MHPASRLRLRRIGISTMFRRTTTLLCRTLAASLASAPTAAAQEYLFSVPQAQMLVTVNPDASVQIEYDFTFQNDPRRPRHRHGGHRHAAGGLQSASVRAWIDDRPLRDVRVSTEVKPGFEVHLGAGAIPPGGSGRFRVEFLVPEHGLPGHDPLRLRLAADHAHVVRRAIRPRDDASPDRHPTAQEREARRSAAPRA